MIHPHHHAALGLKHQGKLGTDMCANMHKPALAFAHLSVRIRACPAMPGSSIDQAVKRTYAHCVWALNPTASNPQP